MHLISNESSNSSFSCSKFNSKSIKFTKLLGVLQLAFASFGQFWFTQINFSKLFDCKWHLLKLREKFSLFQLKTYNLWYLFNYKANNWEHGFTISPPLQMAFDIFCIHLIFMNYQQFLIKKLFCRFTHVSNHFKNVQVSIFINFINKRTFSFGCKWW